MRTKLKNNWKFFLIISLTLGLAPFNPPHLLGKISWIMGGNALSKKHGMALDDWFDLFLHGTPWLLLFTAITLNIFSKIKK
ncbi:hypothetical protein [Polaribacter sp.]|uniref:hypothetical protein n=1 Tax=Polaribacter sp. TaxID=1920175 RepID=UPI0025E57E7B|nr:hypothetical protein [Polaribacter sp.]